MRQACVDVGYAAAVSLLLRQDVDTPAKRRLMEAAKKGAWASCQSLNSGAGAFPLTDRVFWRVAPHVMDP